MISVVRDGTGPVQLGNTVQVTISCDREVSVRALLRHGPILYPNPVADWGPHERVTIFPEAPGDYELWVDWRADGEGGRVTLVFEVIGAESGCPTPSSVVLEGLQLWVPTPWEAASLAHWEGPVLAWYRGRVGVGQTVIDVGANIGVHSLTLAALVGRTGRVVCVEPNPVCVSYLSANLRANGADHAVVIPQALAAAEGEARFLLHHGNSNLGVVGDSPVTGGKLGHAISVRTTTLDALVGDLHLPAPSLVKVDVEGAEAAVIRGATLTLERHRPLLMIEVHGQRSAHATLPVLAELGYRLEPVDDPGPWPCGVDQLIESRGDHVYRVGAIPLARPPRGAG